jgi:hypothetical protein
MERVNPDFAGRVKAQLDVYLSRNAASDPE